MKILYILLISTILFAYDATIEIRKNVDVLPSLAIEEAPSNFDDNFRTKFFKMLFADMNVISLFNVDMYKRSVEFDSSNVAKENLDKSYVLRYRLDNDYNGGFNVYIKLISNKAVVFSKKYHLSSIKPYAFVSHAIAYDINKFMGADSVSWMKKKVVFSKIVGRQQSEIVISDYTLTYQHTILKGGFYIFPKWADKKQTKIYYTSLSSAKPTLNMVDLKKGSIKNIASSEGMIVCSDVNYDTNEILITMAPNSQPDIYKYNTITKKIKRLTTYGGIDVNGQFLDDNSIIFISDRLGYPNIFKKEASSKAAEPLVFYGKNNSSCSVYKNYIVYKARESDNAFSKNTFNLHLISLNTDFIRRLTATGVNEYPRFSDDGDAIIFIKNYKNQSSVGVIRLHHNKNYLFPLKIGRLQSIDW